MLKKQKIHLIAIGGAAMHNIALDLHAQGHIVTGSDDEIYEPSLTRLKQAGICPQSFGWYPDKITKDIDIIILGMHAKADNPELIKAIESGIKVYSYPEFIFHHSKDKKRVVIAGSHGKTTTTAMIMHVLKKQEIVFDYLVGAQLEGFERMVKLTEAPLIIIEGDEYLSSALDKVPKIHHYHPHIAVITGIAWDHINVFPTFELYLKQFSIFVKTIMPDGLLVYYNDDKNLDTIANEIHHAKVISYGALSLSQDKNVSVENQQFPISVIGKHNLQNMNAALLVCEELGINQQQFFASIADFSGASKRLQKLSDANGRVVYLDFAHAPSKVKATTAAFKEWFGNKKLVAVLELHTYSSLNKEFIVQYKNSLEKADKAIVFFNAHTLSMKNMPMLEENFLAESFDHPNIKIFTEEAILYDYLKNEHESNILLMTSGNFNKMSLNFN